MNLLLTGAGGGISKAILPELQALGYTLLLTTRAADDLKAHCEDIGIQAKVFPADLTKEEDVHALFEWVASQGGVDVLVNNAGVAHAAAAWKLDASQMQKVMDTNFLSAVRCTQFALPAMRNKSFGRIISISSVVAHKPSFGTSGYTASKSALEGYMRGVAIDVSTMGITANTIAYGYMNAGMLHDVPEPLLQEVKRGIPMDYFGRPEQIAAAIDYLVKSEYTSGQTLHINGAQWMP